MVTMKKSPQAELQEYSPECYFKNPMTGQRGWTIHHPKVLAMSQDEAAEAIRKLPHFDCFITHGWGKYNVEDPKKYNSAGSISFSIDHCYIVPTHQEIMEALKRKVSTLEKDVTEAKLTVEVYDTNKKEDV